MAGILLSGHFAAALRRGCREPRSAAPNSADVTTLGSNRAGLSRKRIRQVVGATLSHYLAGQHDTHLALWSRVGLRCVGTLFADRHSHDGYRWSRFRRWILRGSSLAYGGTPVSGWGHSCAARRATVFGTLGGSAASHRPPIITSFVSLRFHAAFPIWAAQRTGNGPHDGSMALQHLDSWDFLGGSCSHGICKPDNMRYRGAVRPLPGQSSTSAATSCCWFALHSSV